MLVLNNFNTLLTKSVTAYADKHEINEVLCAKGLTLLGCGAHKLVYKYQNAAVGFMKCSLGKRQRMAVKRAAKTPEQRERVNQLARERCKWKPLIPDQRERNCQRMVAKRAAMTPERRERVK